MDDDAAAVPVNGRARTNLGGPGGIVRLGLALFPTAILAAPGFAAPCAPETDTLWQALASGDIASGCLSVHPDSIVVRRRLREPPLPFLRRAAAQARRAGLDEVVLAWLGRARVAGGPEDSLLLEMGEILLRLGRVEQAVAATYAFEGRPTPLRLEFLRQRSRVFRLMGMDEDADRADIEADTLGPARPRSRWTPDRRPSVRLRQGYRHDLTRAQLDPGLADRADRLSRHGISTKFDSTWGLGGDASSRVDGPSPSDSEIVTGHRAQWSARLSWGAERGRLRLEAGADPAIELADGIRWSEADLGLDLGASLFLGGWSGRMEFDATRRWTRGDDGIATSDQLTGQVSGRRSLGSWSLSTAQALSRDFQEGTATSWQGSHRLAASWTPWAHLRLAASGWLSWVEAEDFEWTAELPAVVQDALGLHDGVDLASDTGFVLVDPSTGRPVSRSRMALRGLAATTPRDTADFALLYRIPGGSWGPGFSVSATVPLGRWSLGIDAQEAWTWWRGRHRGWIADPFDAWSTGGKLSLLRSVEDGQLYVYADPTGSMAFPLDYGRVRRDHYQSVQGTVSWAPRSWAVLSVSCRLAVNRSNMEDLDSTVAYRQTIWSASWSASW